jgi:hypothetical protein
MGDGRERGRRKEKKIGEDGVKKRRSERRKGKKEMEDEGEQEVGREQGQVRIGGERKDRTREKDVRVYSEAVYGGGRLSDMAAALTVAMVMSLFCGLGNFNPKSHSKTHSHSNFFKRL